jgi:hypothetical protein
VLFVDHQATLPFQVSDKSRNAHFWWNLSQRVIISIIHFKSFDFIVMQLADRISIVITLVLFRSYKKNPA